MRIAFIALLGLAGCAAQPGTLRIDVKTDLVPELEFGSVWVFDIDTGFFVMQRVDATQDWFAGVRIGEVSKSMGGLVDLRVEIHAADGGILLERRASAQLDGDTAITVVMSRDCRGVECPGAGDSPSAVACLGARCVDPECLTGEEPECPPPACTVVTDCAATLPDCSTPACIGGVCLALDVEGSCPLGGVCDPDEGCVNEMDPPNPIRSLSVTSENRDDQDRAGSAVAVAGGLLLVALPGDDSGSTGVDGDEADDSASESGAVALYERGPIPLIGDTWLQVAFLKASNTDPGDGFGSSVAVSADGSTLAISAPFEASGTGDEGDDSAEGSGAVYVFVRSGETWVQQGYLKAPNLDADDNFGVVALNRDGSVLAVGAPMEDSGNPSDPEDDGAADAGAVYLFSRAGDTWLEDGYVKASIPGAGDLFGSALALNADGTRLVVGAPGEDGSSTGFDGDESDDAATDAGAVYLFDRSGPSWVQTAYIKASNADAGDAFGTSLALGGIDSNVLTIGAPGEASASTLNGDQSDDSMQGAGAAYVFDLSTSTQEAYVKASNPDADDRFGHAVAMTDGSPPELVVGAPHESSSATRFDGDQDDDAAPQTGAVYRYRGGMGGWTQVFYLKPFNGGPGALFGSSLHLTEDRVIVGAPGYTDDEDLRQTGIFYTLDFL